ncbi:MAG: bifunctional tetrahydrofolate synthase/dihydrofolate synthase [Candidatus Thiodiazotropha sp.]
MRFKTLDQWLDWQATLHPREIELGLERVATVWKRLKPEGLGCPVITVAGTNGKGSCVAMLESVYRRAGYRVGVYTSPHLVRYQERIRLDGEPVDATRLCAVFDAIDRAREQITLTYFEFGTLAALSIFAEERPDLAILEVGLGGRLDAVNIIDADLAVITTIDLDHVGWLGESREAIGIEKAGIMRRDRPVVLADPAMPDSVHREAARIGAKPYALGRDFDFQVHATGWHWRDIQDPGLELPMPSLSGAGQMQNAAAAVMACRLMQLRLEVTEENLAAGLSTVRLQGRLQYLPGRPGILLDVAHNRQAIEGLRASLEQHPVAGRILALFGLLGDKDAAAVAQVMRHTVVGWHLMDLPGERGRSSAELARILRGSGIEAPIRTYPDFATAYAGIRSVAADDDLILIFGSFLVVGEALQHLGIA